MTQLSEGKELLKNVIGRAWQSQTLGNTFWVVGGTAMSALLGAVSSGLYARNLGVDDYGVVTLIVSLSAMMIGLSDLGISGSIVRFGSEAIARDDTPMLRSVVSVAFKAKLTLMAVVLTCSAVFFKPIVRSVFAHVDSAIASYFLLSLIGVSFGMLASFFTPLYQSFRRFRSLAAVNMTQPALKVVVLVLFGIFVGSITIGNAIWIEIGTAGGLLVVTYLCAPRGILNVSESTRDLRRRMFAFNKWLSLYNIIYLLGGRVDLFLVGGLADAHALGFYGAATKIASIVLVMTNSYLIVLLPELSASLTPDLLRRKMRLSFLVVGIFSIGILVLALLADFIVDIVFGPAFIGTGTVLRIMCLGLFFNVCVNPLNATMFAMNRSEVFPLMSGVGIAAMIAADIVFIPRLGAVGAGLAFSLSGLCSLLASATIYLVSVRKKGFHDPVR